MVHLQEGADLGGSDPGREDDAAHGQLHDHHGHRQLPHGQVAMYERAS